MTMTQGEKGINRRGFQDVQTRVSSCALNITSIVDITGRGTYVGGETFTVRVNYANTGDSGASWVDGVLAFNGYLYLSQNSPAPVPVPANSTAYQDFVITVLTSATSAAVTIDCTATGQEEGTGQPLLVESYDNDLDLTIQKQANLAIVSMVDMTGTEPYWRGESFVVRVTYQNTGGTDALVVDGILSFNGYTQLTQSNPATITVAAGSTGYQDFTITVGSSATASQVEIDVTVTGIEAITIRSMINTTTASTDMHVWIGMAAAVVTITSIQDVTGRGTYIGGESFTVRVNYANTGLYGATMDGTLVYNGYGYLTSSNPSATSIPALSTGFQDFTVTASAGATSAAVTIDCSATGVEQYTARSFSVDSLNNDLDLGKGSKHRDCEMRLYSAIRKNWSKTFA
nr:hypothetical protein [Candidatus Sigynarchaeum springense]